MKLARVIGTIWASRRAPNLDAPTLQLVQPLTGELQPDGEPFAAADTVGAGPGELVLYVTAYEAVIPYVTRPGGPGLGTLVPVDAALVGIVEQHERIASWRPGGSPAAPPATGAEQRGTAERQGQRPGARGRERRGGGGGPESGGGGTRQRRRRGGGGRR
ncbi:MAG: hypothetical protein KatS3mg102_1383 [Planctomycetota bacterium]|nr:MAG: hypothetical protein KatS3mg102_1383 [Planctomycetota bacterium]